jgi:malonyl-CoA/methylmalonyl-CoA synthetase
VTSRNPAWARHLPSGMHAHDLDLREEVSLPLAWRRRWGERASQPVLWDPDGWVSAAQLEERSRQVAGRLAGKGLERGDRIIISAATSSALVVAYVAALRLGLVVVPLNAAYQEREVARIVSDSGPLAAIVDGERHGEWIRAASLGPVTIVDPDVDLPAGPPVELDTCESKDLALICYTSGTTGVPKGAMLTHGNLLASAQALRLAWRWEPEDRLVLALPLFHLHGLGVGLHGTLVSGASVVLLPSFSADAVLDAAHEHRASLFFGVPTMYHRLGRSPRLGDLAALRLLVSGSAPLPVAVHARIVEACGQHILERYGMTETVMNVSNPYDGERRPGTVGFPLPGVEVRLGEEGRAGTGPGEILLRGPNVSSGYWRNQRATRAAFDDDGWFRSGDIGQLDEDGYLGIVGRAKELIITGGYNVYPREVEDVLRGHPQVADVAVIGTPSDEWGEVVTAFVVADGPRDPDGLRAFAGKRLAPYKQPRLIRYVNELPRNAMGKIQRDELTRSTTSE